MGRPSHQPSCNGVAADPVLKSVVLETASGLVHWVAGLTGVLHGMYPRLWERVLGLDTALHVPLAVPAGRLE